MFNRPRFNSGRFNATTAPTAVTPFRTVVGKVTSARPDPAMSTARPTSLQAAAAPRGLDPKLSSARPGSLRAAAVAGGPDPKLSAVKPF